MLIESPAKVPHRWINESEGQVRILVAKCSKVFEGLCNQVQMKSLINTNKIESLRGDYFGQSRALEKAHSPAPGHRRALKSLDPLFEKGTCCWPTSSVLWQLKARGQRGLPVMWIWPC